MNRDGSVTLTIPVTNTGKVAGEEIVEVYIRSLDNGDAPIKELKGFGKVSLNPGETQNVSVTLTGESFQYYDESIDELSTRPGRYELLYGGSSDAKDLQAVSLVVK